MSFPNINTNNLFGRLTDNVDLKHGAASGKSWFSASVAVNHNKDEASFFEFKMFGRTAELFAGAHSKGDRVLLTGYFKQETWKDAGGGSRSKVVFMADGFQFLVSGDKPAASADIHRNF